MNCLCCNNIYQPFSGWRCLHSLYNTFSALFKIFPTQTTKRPSVASSMITTITSPHWGVFIRKQMLFYSLFCAIIIDDNRVCRVVLPSFSMNGGDVYGTILFSRLNVFWNVHDSIADVHYFEHKKVILDIEKPPLNFAG